MEFEYDASKSARNKEKHGIDLEEAKGLWDDEDRLLFPAQSETEPRFAMLAEYRQRVWVAFFTVRQQRVRIISVRRARPNEKNMKAEELDRIFDEGQEDILPYLDLAKAVRPGHAAKRVNVDFPEWMLSRLDLEADRLGVPRQSLIKIWIGERLAARRISKTVGPKRRARRR